MNVVLGVHQGEGRCDSDRGAPEYCYFCSRLLAVQFFPSSSSGNAQAIAAQNPFVMRLAPRGHLGNRLHRYNLWGIVPIKNL